MIAHRFLRDNWSIFFFDHLVVLVQPILLRRELVAGAGDYFLHASRTPGRRVVVNCFIVAAVLYITTLRRILYLTYVAHLAMVANARVPAVLNVLFSSISGFLASVLPNRARIGFAEVDAELFAPCASLVHLGHSRRKETLAVLEILHDHLVSHCIQLANVVLGGRVVMSLNYLRVLLARVGSLGCHGACRKLRQVVARYCLLVPSTAHTYVPEGST